MPEPDIGIAQCISHKEGEISFFATERCFIFNQKLIPFFRLRNHYWLCWSYICQQKVFPLNALVGGESAGGERQSLW